MCQWRECSAEVEGQKAGYLRHVYFHAFHVKIKCIGALLIQKSGSDNCILDSQSRNLIPELPEQLQCRYEDCGVGLVCADPEGGNKESGPPLKSQKYRVS